MIDLNLKNLSSEARIGKILVFVALILKVIAIIAMIMGGVFMANYMALIDPTGFGAMFMSFVALGTVSLVVSIAGFILIWKSFDKMGKKDFHTAAVYALISAFLIPLDIVVLLGAILLFLSPEAKKIKK